MNVVAKNNYMDVERERERERVVNTKYHPN